MTMAAADLLIVAGIALPVTMAAACLWARVRASAIDWLWAAPIPAFLAAVFARGRDVVIAPAPLRLTLAIDDAGAMLLGGAALLWGAAGLYAAALLRARRATGGFAVWWLLTLTGSLGAFVVADLTSFYLAFSVASLAAYGLVAFENTAEARRAGRVYMVLALVGEAFLLLGLVMLARGAPGGNALIRDAVTALPAAPNPAAALILLGMGFGLKMGLAPLHVWMPLAHPVAPAPASAALSGIIVKAGVIGLLRFLPLEAGPADWGAWLVAIGLFTAFYGVVLGVTQTRAKTVLAYSTVSQMGLVASILGAGAQSGAGGGAAMLAAFYALHHMLAKGALFLGLGVVAKTGARARRILLAAMGVLALSLAGLPLTSGALAKVAIKPLFEDDLAATLATLSAAGSALLMLHFLRLLARTPESDVAAPPAALTLPWATVALASLIAPWALFTMVTDYGAADVATVDALWKALWPLLLGAGLALALFRWADAVPRLPEGDLIVLAERLGPLIRAAAALIEAADARLRRWPVASAMLVALALALGAML